MQSTGLLLQQATAALHALQCMIVAVQHAVHPMQRTTGLKSGRVNPLMTYLGLCKRQSAHTEPEEDKTLRDHY
jgi:hypothetical protein